MSIGRGWLKTERKKGVDQLDEGRIERKNEAEEMDIVHRKRMVKNRKE